MKIYYTTDGSVDETLQQYCPFGEEHHFEREDGSEFTMPKSVGCIGCSECPYCYGRGYHGYLGAGRPWMLVPIVFKKDGWDYDESTDERQLRMGTRQFRVVPESSYIKCAKCYDDEELKKNLRLKIKMWTWHHIGIRIQDARYALSKFYWRTKFKIEDFVHKYFKRNHNKEA
jgi:hypothetical protein